MVTGDVIPGNGAGNAPFTVNGGYLSGVVVLIGNNSNPGTLTLTSGTFNTGLYMSHAGNGAGTVNLNGGVLLADWIGDFNVGSTGSFTFNFNGGILRTNGTPGNSGQAAELLSNVDNGNPDMAVTTSSNGAFIDTNGLTAYSVRPIANAVGQVGTLTKLGAGTLDISNTNSYTGLTTVSAGTLAVDYNHFANNQDSPPDSILPSGASVSIADGAILSIRGRANASGTSANCSLTAPAQGQSEIVGVPFLFANNLVPGEPVSGTGIPAGTYVTEIYNNSEIMISAPATVTSNTTSNLTFGGATFNAINQVFGSVGLTSGTGTMDVETNGGSGVTVTVTNGITGPGGLTLTGNGVLILNGASTYQGNTNVNGGSLLLGGAASLGNTPVTVNTTGTFGTYQTASGFTNSIGGNLTLNGGSTFSMADGNTSVFDVAGAATLASGSGSAVSMAFDIGGVSGSNNDLLAIAGAASDGAAGDKITITLAGGSLSSGTYTLITAASGLTPADFTLTNTRLTVNNIAYPLSLIGSGTSESVVVGVSGASSLYWSGAQNSVWNTISSGSTNWNTDATSNINSSVTPNSVTDVYFSTSNPAAQNLTNTLGVSTTINSLNFTGTTGPVTINADGSVLTIAATGSSGITVQSGAGAPVINVPIVTGNAQNWTNNSANVLAVNGAVTLGNTVTINGTGAGGTTISGNIGGTGGVVDNNATAMLVLSGSNSYQGGTVINTGTLLAGNANALGSASSSLTINAGTLDLGGNSVTAGTLSGSASAVITSSVSGSPGLITNVTGNSVYAGVIEDGASPVSLTKAGGGTLTLTNANSFTGPTFINGGVLALANGNSLSVSTIITFGGGTLQYIGNATDYSFQIQNSTGPISIDTGNQTVEFNNSLIASNTGGLTVLSSSGGGVLVLDGPQGYTGPTTINPGATLSLGDGVGGNDATINSASVLTNGILEFQTTTNQTPLFTITGSGSVTMNGPGVVNLTGSNSYSGATNVQQGFLTFDNPNAIGSSTITFTGPGTLRAEFSGTFGNSIRSNANVIGTLDNQGNSVTLTGGLTGAGSLAMISSGTFTITGSSNNTGAVYLDGGLVALGSTNAFPTATGTISFGGGTLQYSPQNAADYSSRIVNSTGAISIDTNGQIVAWNTAPAGSNTGGLTKLGLGTLILNGGENYTGTTTVTSGTLQASLNGNILVNGGYLSGVTLGANSGPLTITSGTAYGSLYVNGSHGNAINLNGGVLLADWISAFQNSGGVTFNFNGGTVRASGVSGNGGQVAELLANGGGGQAEMVVTTSSNGAFIDTNGNNENSVRPIMDAPGQGPGTLTKLGSGTLSLSNTNSYTGLTTDRRRHIGPGLQPL